MIDGVIAVCPRCAAELDAVRSIAQVVRDRALSTVVLRCGDCGFVGKKEFGREYFQSKLAPALRWWVRRDGKRPLTSGESMIREFAFDLDAVIDLGDLQLYWSACKPPLEARRRG